MEALLIPPRPGPLWLLAEVTYRCPLHCPFCYNPVDFAQTGCKRARVLSPFRAVFVTARDSRSRG